MISDLRSGFSYVSKELREVIDLMESYPIPLFRVN